MCMYIVHNVNYLVFSGLVIHYFQQELKHSNITLRTVDVLLKC